MDFEIVEKKENALLGRTEVNAVVSFDAATPSTTQMRDLVVQKLGCGPDLTVISKAEPRFGEKKMSISIHVYKDAERMKQVEEKYVLVRNKLVEDEKKEAKAPAPKMEKPVKEEKKEEPAEEKKPEEAPKEEKKEEPKEEEKKE